MSEITAAPTIGLFAVGHAAYWGQFPELRGCLLGYHALLKEMLERRGAKVVDFGMSDSSQRAFEIAGGLAAAGVDLIVCNMTTYATSSVFAPVIQSSRGACAPIVLTALQPLSALDCERANTYAQLQNDNICSVPEFCGVALRMGGKIADVIIGTLKDDAEVSAQLDRWCDIARVLHGLRGARFGLMGHVMEAMYDMHADPTAIAAVFGCHVPLLEADDAVRLWEGVTPAEIEEKKRVILSAFDTPEPVSDPITEKLTPEDLESAARGSAALDRLVSEFSLDGLAYYYGGTAGSVQQKVVSNFIVGNSLLIARGVPMCGEYDIKTLIAMFIMDRLGIGGSFAELHPFDFGDDCILVGHDGPHHLKIADGRPVLRSLKKFHGKPGSGASVEFRIKQGDITLLGIAQTETGKFKFIIGEGESLPGAVPPTGNTNTRARFVPDTRMFIKNWVMQGPTHHFALGVGHHAETLAKLAEALGIEYVVVR